VFAGVKALVAAPLLAIHCGLITVTHDFQIYRLPRRSELRGCGAVEVKTRIARLCSR